MPCPGNPRVKCCKHRRTAQEGSERKRGGGRGGGNTDTKATSPLVPITHVTEDSSPSQC